MITLLTFLWLFNTSQPAQSVLDMTASRAEVLAPVDTTSGFTVTFAADLKPFAGERTLLEIPACSWFASASTIRPIASARTTRPSACPTAPCLSSKRRSRSTHGSIRIGPT